MQRVIEAYLKKPQYIVDSITDLANWGKDLDGKSIYFSGLIVQDSSQNAKGLIREGLSEPAVRQFTRDPKLADCLDADGLSCTEVAARFGDLKVLTALLEQDPLRIKRETADSQNLLHHAACINRPNVDVIEFLCLYEQGRLAGQRNFWAETPLQTVLKRGVLQNVECILPYTKVHLDAPNNGESKPATFTAISSAHMYVDQLGHVLKLLLEIDPVDSQNDRGWTALHVAADEDEEDAWELLLRDLQANPNIRDFHGNTATAKACEDLPVSYLEVLERESRIVIDWWSIDDDGDSLLSLAQRNIDPEVARFMATKTMEPNALEALGFFWYDPIVCADIHTSLGNYDAAIKRLERSGPHEKWKFEAQIFHKTARLQLEINAPEAAVVLLKKSLAMYHTQNDASVARDYDDWTTACIHTTLAKAFMKQNRFLDALESINTALSTEWRAREKRILLGLQIRAKEAKRHSETREAYLAAGFTDMSLVSTRLIDN